MVLLPWQVVSHPADLPLIFLYMLSLCDPAFPFNPAFPYCWERETEGHSCLSPSTTGMPIPLGRREQEAALVLTCCLELPSLLQAGIWAERMIKSCCIFFSLPPLPSMLIPTLFFQVYEVSLEFPCSPLHQPLPFITPLCWDSTALVKLTIPFALKPALPNCSARGHCTGAGGRECFTSVVNTALHPPFELLQLSLRCTKSKEKRGSMPGGFAPLLLSTWATIPSSTLHYWWDFLAWAPEVKWKGFVTEHHHFFFWSNLLKSVW